METLFKEQRWRNESMPNKRKSPSKQQPMVLNTDFLGEDRHELVAKLAYKLWEARGRPLGSPEIDWFAAERAVYSALVTSGLIEPSAVDARHMAEKLYA
jgi:hypothetical protein